MPLITDIKEKLADTDYRVDGLADVIANNDIELLTIVELIDATLDGDGITASEAARRLDDWINEAVCKEHEESRVYNAEAAAESARENEYMEKHWESKYGDAA